MSYPVELVIKKCKKLDVNGVTEEGMISKSVFVKWYLDMIHYNKALM